MRVISKKISYNEFQSRIPGMIPALADYWRISSLYENCTTNSIVGVKMYDHDAAIKTINQYNIPESDLHYGSEFVSYDIETMRTFENGNYGHIPSDIIIPKEIADTITDYTDLYVNIPDGNGDFYDLSDSESDYHYKFVNGRYEIVNGDEVVKIITHKTFTKWWKFFKEYHELLFNAGYGKSFSSATESYDYLNNNIEESERQYYVDLDELYVSRGGDAMFKWACENCVIRFNIPKQFSNEWKSGYLYYSEALKWYAWFSDRYKLYRSVTADECKATEDCCDCAEYFRLGGNEFYDVLYAWIKDVNTIYNQNVDKGYFTNSASFTIPITLQTSIDDLGQMSIFSNEWIAGEDYTRNTIFHQPYYTDENGDIQYENDYFLTDNTSKTYEFDNCTHDISFNSANTRNYSDYYIASHIGEFNTDITSYTYSPLNGELITNPTDDDVCKDYKINHREFVLINNVQYDVIDGEYVVLCDSLNDRSIADINFLNHKILPVYRNGETNLRFCIYNGIRYYVENDGSKDVIRFFKNVRCVTDSGCPVSKGKYIVYGDNVHFVNGNSVSILDDNDFSNTYEIAHGTFEVDNRTYYINNSGKVTLPSIENTYGDKTIEVINENDVWTEETFEDVAGLNHIFVELSEETLYELGWKYVNVNENTVRICYEYEPIYVDKVSGYSESKLELLRRFEVDTDDLGNELPGYFKNLVDISKKGNGKIYYSTVYDGATLDILYEEGTVSELEKLSDGNYFGNYLEKIIIYYTDDFDNLMVGENVNGVEDGIYEIKKGTTISDAIDKLNSSLPYHDEYKLMMNVEYYIGCTLKCNNHEYELVGYTGVKHTDSLTVTKEIGTYYTSEGGVFLFNYYALAPFLKFTYNDTLRAKKLTMDSYFEMVRPLFRGIYYENSDGLTKYNDMTIAPVMRNEWDLFSSTPQIVNRDIYIDRGINAAFEKHLKLQEVRTMEALENYGINYFKLQNF